MKRNEEILYLESDSKMFEDRFARCRRLLHFLAARVLGSEDEAEDAVRNCRAAASRNPPSFESEGAFRSWLARILIDEACALIRRKQFSLMRSPKSLLTNPEGSSAYHLYGDDDANTLEISTGSFGSRNAPNHLLLSPEENSNMRVPHRRTLAPHAPDRALSL